MKLHKIILLVGITLLTTTANAQQTFDVNLYNMLPEHSNGDLSDTAKVKVFLPDERDATEEATAC